MTRDKLAVPDGLYAVPSPDDSAVMTYWWVVDGVVRDYPQGERHRPLPPPAPCDLTDGADRRSWTQRWYDETYHPWRDAVDAAILADPAAAAERFRARYPDATLPDPSTPRPRPARKRAPRSRRLPPVDRQRAAEQLAAHALRQAGMSVRDIAGVLELSTMSAWRRVRAVTDAREAARVRATLLERADRLQASLLVESTQHPERREEISRWIADLREAVATLAAVPGMESSKREYLPGDESG